jgi:hypothetical protein
VASFSEPDPTEISEGKLAEDMTAEELMLYFVASQKRVNDLDMGVRFAVDRKIFERLISKYPQPRAGRIVKWVFFRGHGKASWNGGSNIVRTSQFSEGWSWLIEQWNVQYQMYLRREERAKVSAKSSGFLTAEDL